MIKFFRKIRQKLLSENKFSKYLLYAIGEIALVVIGILIALSINNWNEDRKKGKLERVLLNETYQSIKQDTIGFLGEAFLLKRFTESVGDIKNAFEKDLPYQKSLDTSFARLASWKIFEPDYAVYDHLNEVGMEIIQNDSIKIALKNYYKDSKFWAKEGEDDRGKNIMHERIYPKYFKAYRWHTYAVPVDFETLKTANDFLIALDYCATSAGYFSSVNKRKQERARGLLELIKKELAID
jgi:hypothetical protein